MGKLNIALCRPDSVYIITEKVYHNVLGWGKVTINGKNVGIDAHKVTRSVVQACIAQDYYVDGKRRDGMPTTWEYLKEQFGLTKIEGRDKPGYKVEPYTAYIGYKNLGEVFGQRKSLPSPSPYTYGTDPVPHVKLYGNSKINFHMPGGKGNPTAIIIYDPRNKVNPITQVPPIDHPKVVNMLKKRAKKYQPH